MGHRLLITIRIHLVTGQIIKNITIYGDDEMIIQGMIGDTL